SRRRRDTTGRGREASTGWRRRNAGSPCFRSCGCRYGGQPSSCRRGEGSRAYVASAPAPAQAFPPFPRPRRQVSLDFRARLRLSIAGSALPRRPARGTFWRSSMVSVVIHAGCYKTATSTIQAIAQKNRARFLADFGVLYPKTGARANQGIPDPDSVAHHLLFHAAKASADGATAGDGGVQFANFRAKLEAEVRRKDARRVFISTELR